MCASPNRDDMLRGSGKKMAGLYGYSNLGYIEYQVEKKALKNTFTFGRSYLNHSLSKYGSILISRWSRPFDNMTWALNYKGLSGKISVIELDEIENNNRYLSAHSLNLRFNTLTLYLAETALYAGKNRFLEFQYINPTLLWLPIRENQPNSKQANNTIYVGVSYETGKFRLFSEFLLDDYQKDEYMLEPATFGYIVGVDSLSTNIIKYLLNIPK